MTDPRELANCLRQHDAAAAEEEWAGDPDAIAEARDCMREAALRLGQTLDRLAETERERDSWEQRFIDLETHRASCCDQNEQAADVAEKDLALARSRIAELEAEDSTEMRELKENLQASAKTEDRLRETLAAMEAQILEIWEWLAGRHKCGVGESALGRVRKAETCVATLANWEDAHPGGSTTWASKEIEGRTAQLEAALRKWDCTECIGGCIGLDPRTRHACPDCHGTGLHPIAAEALGLPRDGQ